MEEIKEMIMNHIVERYADASAEVTNGSNMLDSLNILSDAEYCKQIVDYVIDTKVKHGDRYDIATSVKFLKMEISENHIMWLTRAHSLSGLYGNHKITYKNKRRNKWNVNMKRE